MQTQNQLPDAPDGQHDVAGLLSWSADAAGNRQRFGDAWSDFIGRACNAGSDWRAGVHPEDRDGVDRAFRQAFSLRQPHEAEYRVRRTDGQYRWLFEQAMPAYADDGSLLGYNGICVDITRRKLAEHSLRESEQRFRRSFENPLGGMIIASPEKVLLEVNDKLCEILGYSRDELVGRTWAEFTHPDDLQPNSGALDDVIAGRSEGYVLEKRYRRKDGRTLHAVISARAVRDEKGHLQYLVTMVQDVTASRKMERVMQGIVESTSAMTGESFFRSLVQNIAEALNVRYALVGQLVEPDMISTVAVWNGGRTADDFCYSLADAACGQMCGKPCAQRHGQGGHFPGWMRDEIGKGRSACSPLLDSGGRMLGLIAVADDNPLDEPEQAVQILKVFATRAGAELERLRADRELKRSRALLHSVVEHVPQALFLKDARDLRYVLHNRAGEVLLGRRREELVGRQDPDLFPAADARRFIAEDRQVLASGEMLEIPEQPPLATPNGNVVLRVQKIPLVDENGRPEYLLGIAEDVTQRKQVERQLIAAKAEAERANNAKSRFLAAASHDLRQPLSALSLYLGVLKNKVAPADRPLVGNMKDCVGSLSELLTDLLDLSKLDAGVVMPNVVDFPIAEVLANLVSVHAPDALVKGLRLRCVPSQSIANTDPVLFRRMLGNLIGNAIRYTEQGSVLVGCRRRDGRIWVEVRDTGIGIPEDKTGEIFEEFRQLGNDERNGSRGSGLGLAIVAKTAALLGLQIRVRSRPGKGSVFAVEMPPGRETSQPAPAESLPRQLRIALVEDSPVVRDALTCTLSQAGHEVVAAAGGDELLERLGCTAPDIVISDYRLAGGETGFHAIAAARARFGADVPALIITGDTDPQTARSMADRGLVIQHKPLDVDALLACVATLTEPAATR